MQNTMNLIIVALVALAAGFVGGYMVRGGQVPEGAHVMPNGEVMGNMGHAMDEMMANLQGKTGDEFDKAFLTEMIVHHEGAVDMSAAVLRDAKHEELKEFAKKIISAQTAEIQQMKDWRKTWYNY